MRTYKVKLHEDDVLRIPMMRMGMEQDDSNDDADMICDILYQIENQALEELDYKNLIEDCEKEYGKAPWTAEQIMKIKPTKASEAWRKMESTNPEYRLE